MGYRIVHNNSTACYLKKDNKVLMIKFYNKWGQVYAPPGGKFETDETPSECIIREFYEETGLTLINPKLQGISYWHDSIEGIIFVIKDQQYCWSFNIHNCGCLWMVFGHNCIVFSIKNNKSIRDFP